MLAPLLGRLHRGAGQTEVEEFLRQELVKHFGLAPSALRPGTMAARVTTWWTSPGRTDSTASSRPGRRCGCGCSRGQAGTGLLRASPRSYVRLSSPTDPATGASCRRAVSLATGSPSG